MEQFDEYIEEYRRQLEAGTIKKAYQGILGYFSGLRLSLSRRYPDYLISSSLQDGRMDYTYFYFIPPSLKQKKIKTLILFDHENFTVKLWLAGYNKTTQGHYQKLFLKNGWNKYELSKTTKNVDSIIECSLIENPDFKDLESLTQEIEQGMLIFIDEIKSFLSEYDK